VVSPNVQHKTDPPPPPTPGLYTPRSPFLSRKLHKHFLVVGRRFPRAFFFFFEDFFVRWEGFLSAFSPFWSSIISDSLGTHIIFNVFGPKKFPTYFCSDMELLIPLLSGKCPLFKRLGDYHTPRKILQAGTLAPLLIAVQPHNAEQELGKPCSFFSWSLSLPLSLLVHRLIVGVFDFLLFPFPPFFCCSRTLSPSLPPSSNSPPR